MRELVQKREELAAKQKAMAAIFAEAGSDLDLSKVTSLSGSTAEKAAEIKRRNDEMNALGAEVEALVAAEKAAGETRAREERLNGPAGAPAQPGAKSADPYAGKGIGDLFVESVAYTQVKGRQGPVAVVEGVDVKTLMSTSAGWSPEATRTGRVELTPERALSILDLPSPGETGQNAVVYMEETTKTNNAAEVAEGGTYGEAALALTERSQGVRKIGVWLPLTDEQLQDEPQVRGYVNNRLTRMLRERADSQLMSGNGVAPNLTGYLSVAGIQTQAKGATEPALDAILKAITKVRFTGFAEPDAVVFHPNDWQDLVLTRTADGLYVLGNPSGGPPERVWGLRPVVSPAATENTGLVGAFRAHSEFALRRGIEFQVTNSHSTHFVEGKQAVRADFRAVLVVYRPLAFCTVTSI